MFGASPGQCGSTNVADFFHFFKLYKNKKLPSKIFFNGPKGIGKSTIAYHLINYIFSSKEEYKYDLNNLEINYLNKSHKLILNNTHPNFHHVDIMEDKKIIEKAYCLDNLQIFSCSVG